MFNQRTDTPCLKGGTFSTKESSYWAQVHVNAASLSLVFHIHILHYAFNPLHPVPISHCPVLLHSKNCESLLCYLLFIYHTLSWGNAIPCHCIPVYRWYDNKAHLIRLDTWLDLRAVSLSHRHNRSCFFLPRSIARLQCYSTRMKYQRIRNRKATDSLGGKDWRICEISLSRPSLFLRSVIMGKSASNDKQSTVYREPISCLRGLCFIEGDSREAEFARNKQVFKGINYILVMMLDSYRAIPRN